MRNNLRDNQGFAGILEIILIAIVLGAIGVTVYTVYVYSQHAKPPLSSQATPTPSPTPAVSMAGWKTYTSAFEGAAIKYPPTWQATVQDGSSDGPDFAAVTLTGPDGGSVSFVTPMHDMGGSCTERCSYTVQSVTPLSTKGLDLVQESETIAGETSEVLGVMDHADAAKLTIGKAVSYADLNAFPYQSRKNPQYYLLLMTNFNGTAKTSPADFAAARQILSSVTY